MTEQRSCFLHGGFTGIMCPQCMAEAGTGYSQQTVDALTKERDWLQQELTRHTAEITDLRNGVEAGRRAAQTVADYAEIKAVINGGDLRDCGGCVAYEEMLDLVAEALGTELLAAHNGYHYEAVRSLVYAHGLMSDYIAEQDALCTRLANARHEAARLGYCAGHSDTVEGTYADPSEVAADICQEMDDDERKQMISVTGFREDSCGGLNVKLGKYMTAYPVSNGRREPWAVKGSNGQYIAYLEWYPPWKQYVFNAESDAVFSGDCLDALARFCGRLTGGGKHSTRLTDGPVNSGSCNDGELGEKCDQEGRRCRACRKINRLG